MPAKHSISTINKRRQQLTRQLVLQMMDRKENGQDTPGLLTKLIRKLETDLDSEDKRIQHAAMDKIIKLMPFVIAKEKAPALQLNVQNNNTPGGPQISAGKSTGLAIGTIQDYLEKREARVEQLTSGQIEDAQIVEFEDDEEDEEEGRK